jgi:adenylate cyclase
MPVAVMFLDLSGSTGVVEAMGPERSRDLLHAMRSLVEREVTERRGIVINFMGDGVLAVFGLPKPQSDDAARAFATVESLHASVASRARDRALHTCMQAQERLAVTLGPGIFYRARSTRRRPYEQYRLDGESVVCERITPNARSSGASHVKHLQSWTVGDFLIANVLPRAKDSLQQVLSERHAKRS